MKKITVSVLGAGNGGQALSAHLTINGCEVIYLNILNLKKILKR